MGENWGESTITWNNAPQNDTTDGKAMLSGTVPLGTFTFTGRTATVDFTGTGGTVVRYFVAASATDDLVTFVVVRDTIQPSGNTYVHAMYAKEHSSQPALAQRLELTAVPEPSSFLLSACTVCALLLRRRK